MLWCIGEVSNEKQARVDDRYEVVVRASERRDSEPLHGNDRGDFLFTLSVTKVGCVLEAVVLFQKVPIASLDSIESRPLTLSTVTVCGDSGVPKTI